VDCFWLVDGEAIGDLKRKVNGKNGYHVMAEDAQAIGLTAALYWTQRDAPHVQIPTSSSIPSDLYSITDIDRLMEERFGE